MSHALNIHDGLGQVARDPSIGILLAYGSTVPTSGTPGYAPGCVFIKSNGTTLATTSYTNLGTVSSASFMATSNPSTGLGYSTGVGGAVTQATSRTTGVTLNKICGQITTHTASLAAAATAKFTVTNSLVAATDDINVSIQSGSTTDQTDVKVQGVLAGSFDIVVANRHASTAETGAIVINFAVTKSVAS